VQATDRKRVQPGGGQLISAACRFARGVGGEGSERQAMTDDAIPPIEIASVPRKSTAPLRLTMAIVAVNAGAVGMGMITQIYNPSLLNVLWCVACAGQTWWYWRQIERLCRGAKP
jgi:hypothetical protein